MEYMLAVGDHSGVAIYIFKLYHVLVDAALFILSGCRWV